MPSIRLSARRALVSVKLAVAGLLLGTAAHAAAPAPVPAPEFTGIQTWLNSEPRTLASLRGKVVLVDFWTYTCINCINTLPYVKQWHQKYKDQGLVVVGVHTPEFPFERTTKNVADAIKRFGIEYPVAQDNDYKTWDAYRNQYWPAFYLIDKGGQHRLSPFWRGALRRDRGRDPAPAGPAPVLSPAHRAAVANAVAGAIETRAMARWRVL